MAKVKKSDELIEANKELAFQHTEKEKRAAELKIANVELDFQHTEKEKRAAELKIANVELDFQNKEKEKRATELSIANEEIIFQNEEKEKRAAELIVANKELVFQNEEKEKRAAELSIANIELLFQNQEKEKRKIENKELEAYSNAIKQASQYARSLLEASLDPLVTISPEGKITDVNNASIKVTGVARESLIGTDFSDYFTVPEKAREGYKKVFENGFVADYPLTIRHQNGTLTEVLYNASVYKDDEGHVLGVFAAARDVTAQKAKDFSIANKKLTIQNKEKEKRATELSIANEELIFQNEEKEKRAAELGVAIKELAFQNEEKEKRAAELIIATKIISDYKYALDESAIVGTTDHRGIISYANDNFCRISKYSRGELIGQDHRIINSGYHPKEFIKNLWATIESGKVWKGEIKNKAKDGSLYWVNSTIIPILNDKGKPYQYIAIRIDITFQKEIQEKLAFENEEKEKRAAELSIANAELAFQNAEKEKRAAEVGIANEALIFQNAEKEKRAAELIVANKELAFQNLEKEKRAAELLIANTELAYQNQEKEKRAAELSIANAELAFQNAEKEKRAAELGIANEALIFQNAEKEKRAAELIVANKELAFQNLEKEKRAAELLIANTELAYQNQEKEKRAAELSIANAELAFQNAEKEKRAAELGIANEALIFQNAEKEKRAAELIVANKELILQSEEKQLLFLNNRQKQKENKNLESTLADLKAAQSLLIQSEKMASLGELAAGIAHEIQNPLNFVNNFSEVSGELIEDMIEEIDSGNMDEVRLITKDLKENLEKILHHGNRADAIVKGMLQHSRSNASEKEATNLNALAEEYLRLAYHGLRAKDKSFNATMKTDFDESIGEISIIPQDVGRVILNLIINAFYAVSEKKKELGKGFEPLVSVSTKKVGKRILISVKDNGNGIPPHVLEKIFQPFFTTKPAGQGTGLGLSLSYDIVKAHGGELKVNTKVGESTEFQVSLLL